MGQRAIVDNMKLTLLIQKMKKRRQRVAVIIAAAVVAYLVFVGGPQLSRVLRDLWRDAGAFFIRDNSIWVCMALFGLTLVELVGMVVFVRLVPRLLSGRQPPGAGRVTR